MIKAVIIEDVQDNREVIKRILADNYPNIYLAGEAESVEEGYNLIKKERPKLVFQDIELIENIVKAVNPYSNFNEYIDLGKDEELEFIISKVKQGEKIALVSDAGTPGISDPGFLLSREARREGIEVNCLPGATACIPALVNSGLPSDKFHFEGFLPHKKGKLTRLKYLAQLEATFIIYASPHRVTKTIQQLIEHCGEDRAASLSRELTKLHEETMRGSLNEILGLLEAKPSIKGEIVVVIAGKKT